MQTIRERTSVNGCAWFWVQQEGLCQFWDGTPSRGFCKPIGTTGGPDPVWTFTTSNKQASLVSISSSVSGSDQVLTWTLWRSNAKPLSRRHVCICDHSDSISLVEYKINVWSARGYLCGWMIKLETWNSLYYYNTRLARSLLKTGQTNTMWLGNPKPLIQNPKIPKKLIKKW